MHLFIKNMVCDRCILVVKQQLDALKMPYKNIQMGEVELVEPISSDQLKQFNARIKETGFELLDDQKQKQIEKIKSLLIHKVQSGEVEEHFIISEFLSKSLHKDYNYISRLFSDVESITIEQFFILQKIEKVKEWLVYEDLNLNEISYRLGYSSVSHLSAQFKKVTGLTPSHFKKTGNSLRKSLDSISPQH